MDIEFFCPLWGLVEGYTDKIAEPLEPVLEKIKMAGYDGVELTIITDGAQQQQLTALLRQYNLKAIALQWAAEGNGIENYLKAYDNLVSHAAGMEPVFVNCHSGKDYYTFDDNCRVIEKAFELEQRLGIPIVHETHRSRFTFHAWHIQPYLNKYPDLKIAADFSHWCNVSESFLQDQSESVQQAIKHASHIHARVGHPQGCQVNDPRAPEWAEAVGCHLNWWDGIVSHQKNSGNKLLTITPEFGPEPYMPVMPYSRSPLASQWDINLWMMNLLKSRYEG